MKYILLFVSFFLLYFANTSYGQNKQLDSLLSILEYFPDYDTSKLKILNKIGNEYLKKKDLNNAKFFFVKNYFQATKIQSKLYLAHSYNLLARINEEEGNLNNSIVFHKAAIILFTSLHNEKAIRSSNLGLARSYLRLNDFRKYTKYEWGFELLHKEELKSHIKWIYTGFFIFFFLYNLLLYRFSKDKSYYFLSLTIFWFEIFNEFNDSSSWFFLDFPIIYQSIFFCIVVSSLFFSNYFFTKFFSEIIKSNKEININNLKSLTYFNRLILIIIATSIIIIISYGIFYDYDFLFWHNLFRIIVMNFDEVGFIMLCFILLAIITIRFTKKLKDMNYLIFGTFLFFIGAGLSEIGSNLNIDWVNNAATHSLGACLFLLFLSVQVASKIEIFRKDKENAQIKALENLEIIVNKRTLEIKEQKYLIEEKHREITDSINYAERIQRSFLATKEQLDSNLKDYFVLFQPKDVVSGDFYWAHALKNGNFSLVTADSTGHGVPGAIMSLLNTSSLERAVELGIIEPAEILNHTRQTIIERLKKDGSAEGGKDGMDCSLISFNSNKSKLTYSAANNPIWIIRNETMIELAADKMPVGKHDNDSVSFTQHEIELQNGDLIYTLTDGFPDQFGGPKGKKLMYKKLKEFLINISQLPMNEQKEQLEISFNNWKGDLEQVDDVCLIGIKV